MQLTCFGRTTVRPKKLWMCTKLGTTKGTMYITEMIMALDFLEK